MPTPVTPNRNYPNVDPANFLDEDVLRLVDAVDMIDLDVAALFTAVAGKAATVHGHAQSDITGLVSDLAGKAAAGHTHALDDLSDVNTSGAASGHFLRLSGSAWISVEFAASMIASGTIDMARLASHLAVSALNAAYAAASHTHAQSNITNLVADLATLTAGIAASLAKAGGTMTGPIDMADQELVRPKVKDYSMTLNARGSISGAQDFNYTAGNFVTATITGATQISITNPPATGSAGAMVMQLTNGGAGAITWPTGTKWAGGIAPSLTVSGVDVLIFTTIDAGTTWRAALSMKDSK